MKSEIRIVRTMDAGALRKRADQLARDARKLDIRNTSDELGGRSEELTARQVRAHEADVKARRGLNRGTLVGSRAGPSRFDPGTGTAHAPYRASCKRYRELGRPDVDRVRRGRVWGTAPSWPRRQHR